jgi:predicted 3-demethylubiquinone-9 3-methyltransferase (glyoxalase superfamily)
MFRYGESGAEVSGMQNGQVMVVEFEIEGQLFTALNGGPIFKFNPAISFVVNCENQDEVDELWEKLTEEGEEVECGWLTDKYGISWQIVPVALGQLMSDPDPVKSERVMKAMLKMKKIEIDKLLLAYEGK